MAEFAKVVALADLTPGTGQCATVGGKEIAVFNVDGKIHAIDNNCLHQGGPLGEGDLQGATVTCPWHGWMFDVTTGVSPVNPTMKVATYEAKVEGNDILVKI